MLNVIIAGAGVTGLVAAFAFARNGHTVNVYERKQERVFATEGGGGIQLQSNAMRILDTWGIDVSDIGLVSHGVVMRRGANGERLGLVEPANGLQVYMLRSDFRRAMLAKALATGVRVHFDVEIADIDSSRPSISLRGGHVVDADLIIGADGIRSQVRHATFPGVKPNVTSECVFLVQIPFSALQSDAAKQVVAEVTPNVIVGDRTAIVLGILPSRQLMDLQFIMMDYAREKNMDSGKWLSFVDDLTELRTRYKSFGGFIPEVLSLATSAWNWRLVECQAPTWVSENGRVILAGDAVHGMVPYSGQGAGMCIEDTAVLCELFRHVSPDDGQRIAMLAKAYQGLRKPRTDACWQRAKALRETWGFPDGVQQQRRDALFSTLMDKKAHVPLKGDRNAHPLSHEFDNWLEQYDAIQEARDALRNAGPGERASKL